MIESQKGNAGPRVLIIDDESRLCLFLSDNLSMMGCTVQAAHTGESGVDKTKEEEFDVVLCDIMMPGNGGIWALETLKGLRPSTEVIMMTGFATKDSAEVCKTLGAFSFMTKPFEIDDVRTEVEKAYQRKLAQPAVVGARPAEIPVAASAPSSPAEEALAKLGVLI